MGQIKLLRSGLTAHLRANEAQLSSLGKQQLRAWMASRANADMDAKTRDRDPIKLSNAKESLSFTDHEKLVGQLFRDGKLFLWLNAGIAVESHSPSEQCGDIDVDFFGLAG